MLSFWKNNIKKDFQVEGKKSIENTKKKKGKYVNIRKYMFNWKKRKRKVILKNVVCGYTLTLYKKIFMFVYCTYDDIPRRKNCLCWVCIHSMVYNYYHDMFRYGNTSLFVVKNILVELFSMQGVYCIQDYSKHWCGIAYTYSFANCVTFEISNIHYSLYLLHVDIIIMYCKI